MCIEKWFTDKKFTTRSMPIEIFLSRTWIDDRKAGFIQGILTYRRCRPIAEMEIEFGDKEGAIGQRFYSRSVTVAHNFNINPASPETMIVSSVPLH